MLYLGNTSMLLLVLAVDRQMLPPRLISMTLEPSAGSVHTPQLVQPMGSFGVLFGGDENDPLAKTNLSGPGVMRGPRYSVERSDPSR